MTARRSQAARSPTVSSIDDIVSTTQRASIKYRHRMAISDVTPMASSFTSSMILYNADAILPIDAASENATAFRNGHLRQRALKKRCLPICGCTSAIST